MLSLCFACACRGFAEPDYRDFDKPPHDYWTRPLNDRFTKLKSDFESGKIALDRSGEKAFLLSLLKVLEIPASSQLLVFSTTSLQLRLISPSNPRAIFFNEDLYVGYIPGGRIEIVSLDPELGGIFYIFDVPRDDRPLRVERSDRCMNCHAGADTQFIPGLVIQSVIPGPRGGSLDAFRREQSGHGISFDQRFGGWHVTGKNDFTNHWGNLIGRLSSDGLATNRIEAGTRFDFARYAASTSDILPHLVLEHQNGFVNRVLEASYRARTHLHASNGQLNAEQAAELEEQAKLVTRYLLFADEAQLPSGGVEGDAAFKADFLSTRRAATNGRALKDFELSTRLFKNRCSYMIYSAVFQGLPATMKGRIFARLASALNTEQPHPDFAYLPPVEKQTIRAILKETLADLPAGW